MTAKLLQQIQIWWKTVPVRQPDQQQHLQGVVGRDFVLGSLVVWLSEQRGMLSAGQKAWRSPPHIHLQVCQTLQSLYRIGLPVPQAWLHPPVILGDAVLQPLLSCFESEDQAVTSVSILGQIYEIYEGFLDCPTGKARKSGGVYYTPQTIADYMIEATVGTLLEHQPLPQILDPACGGGVFLVTAYQYLLDWHLQQQLNHCPAALVEIKGQFCLSIAAREQILLRSIYGVDIDPQVVAVTQIGLLLKLIESTSPLSRPLPSLNRNIQWGNALLGSDFYDRPKKERDDLNPVLDWDTAFANVLRSGGFDVVTGNPPYIDAETMTLQHPDWRQYCTRHYQTASGNWDIFCVFVEKALELCRFRGLTSLIVPNKLASANYAAKARSLLSRENQLLAIRDYSQVSVFSAAVYPIVYIAQKGLPQCKQSGGKQSGGKQSVRYEVMASGDQQTAIATCQLDYAHFLSDRHPWLLSVHPQQLGLTARLRQDLPALETIAQVKGAATVAEAYALQTLIHEGRLPEAEDLRLVNSGTIDRYHICWGERRLRYLGATFLHPIIPQHLTARLPSQRLQQSRQPKLLVAGLVKRLKCAADLDGSILAGKSTCIILTAVDLRYLLGLLNSSLVNLYFTRSFSGNHLQGGYLRVGPPQLRQIPIPAIRNGGDRHRCDRLISLVEQMLLQQTALQTASELQMIRQQILDLEQQIDGLVYELYRLTDAEIAAVISSSG